VPKKNAGVRDQDGAGSSRKDSKHEQRSAQRRRPQAGVARRDNEEPRRGLGDAGALLQLLSTLSWGVVVLRRQPLCPNN
jgi:hypothetical protein